MGSRVNVGSDLECARAQGTTECEERTAICSTPNDLLPVAEMHYLLFYDVVADYVERRAAFRTRHLEHARASHLRGELILGGALAEPVDGAVLLFRGMGSEVAERFALADPYVMEGLVTSWKVREWTIAIGGPAGGTQPG